MTCTGCGWPCLLVLIPGAALRIEAADRASSGDSHVITRKPVLLAEIVVQLDHVVIGRRMRGPVALKLFAPARLVAGRLGSG